MYDRSPPSWSRSLGPLSLLVFIALPAFLGGALVERWGWLPGSRAYVPARLGDTFDPFWEAWGDVEKYYVDRAAVDPEHMTAGAIEGMLDSLGDVGHTTYLSRQGLKDLENALKGNMEGIGALMTIRGQQPTVMQTMPGSPARKAGLRPDDIILEVDSKPVAGLPLERVAALVRGPKGTQVKLDVRREGQRKTLKFTITRARVDVPAVTWRLLPGVPVAQVAIREFGERADDQLKEAIKGARQQGAKGLLVDIRGDPGGAKEQAVKVTSEFLKDGVVFIEKDAAGHKKEIPVLAGGVATDLPLVVLIDKGTASSAEIFAGAIQDHRRGKLVGTKTFGTGTVLRPFELKDGSAILLAVSEWLTPKGRQIWHHGLTPDIEVTLPRGASILLPDDQKELTAAQLAHSDDTQLRRGLEVLQEQQGGKKAAAAAAK